MYFLFLILLTTAHAENIKTIDHCAAPGQQIWLIKQWHLAPSTNTKNSNLPISKAGKKYKEFEQVGRELQPPQTENQVAIYKEISSWVEKKKEVIFLAEGCSWPTEINKNYNNKFNGWSVLDLKSESKKPRFESLITHIGLKLESKYNDKIKTMCADDEELIKKSQLVWSDARADASYLNRIAQFKDDQERLKTYLDGAIEAYQLPKSATAAEAVTKIKQVLKDDIQKFRQLTDERSKKLSAIIAEQAKKYPTAKIVVVWGGLHIPQLKIELDALKQSCIIAEPKGYEQNEEKLLLTLEEALK